MARILVIDDEPMLRLLLKDILQTAGHEVITAVDGRQGVHRYRARRPDLVITDIFMPEMDGLDVILHLGAEVRVIAISGGGRLDAREYLRHAHDLGAWRTLQKPVSVGEILATVDEALTR